MLFLPLRKLEKPICLLAKHRAWMQFLPRSINWWTSNGREIVVSMHVEEGGYPTGIQRCIHIYKRKGNPQVCDNHRGISLLSIAGKVLAKMLLNAENAKSEAKMQGTVDSMPQACNNCDLTISTK